MLDRLLEENRLEFDGITGTSAGAVNAVVLADGLAAGGREGAREALRVYWRKVSALSARGIFRPSVIDKANPDFGLEHSLGFMFLEPLTYFASPYQMNPFNYNPFKDLLAEAIDFERVRRQTAVKLFLCATDVQTAKMKIFYGNDIDVNHVLASTCLPLLMQAVEVDGEYYWDGSYAGNPAIFPLIYDCEAPRHPDGPHHAGRAAGRSDHFARDHESHAGDQLQYRAYPGNADDRLSEQARSTDGRYKWSKRMLVHLIEAEDLIRSFSWSSRLNGDWDFLMHLCELGRKSADAWLNANFDRIGIESTVDLEEKYF